MSTPVFSPYGFEAEVPDRSQELRTVEIVHAKDERITIVRSANDSDFMDSAQLHQTVDVDAPMHVGSNWMAPAPVRAVEDEHPWLIYVYFVGAIAAVLASAFAPYWVQP